MSNIKIFNDWLDLLKDEFEKPYMHKVRLFMQEQKQLNKCIYPSGSDIFNALNTTSFADTKVVILGQDPYHGMNQAHGLSFSVRKGVAIPPSLKNIYKELNSDLGIEIPYHGCLESWASRGVLLLNSVLTVESGKAASHANILGKGKGWESFTDTILQILNFKKGNIVFILWGGYARAKASFLDPNKHLILQSAHPSPLSAYNGFFNSKPFSKANTYLLNNGLQEIDWKIE